MENSSKAVNTGENGLELATVGTGCFWCTEAVFQNMEGIVSVESGYSGGHVDNPTYEQICAKTTGHAEVVRLTYDPAVVSYAEILEVFWRTHNPTTLNRQGNDVGPQYRSAIFYHNEEQKAIALQSKTATDASSLWPDPIVTEIGPLINYFVAEEYHQNYFNRIGDRNPYCTYIVKPKVDKFKKEFKERLKKG